MKGILVLTKYFGILVSTKFNLSGERVAEVVKGFLVLTGVSTCTPVHLPLHMASILLQQRLV